MINDVEQFVICWFYIWIFSFVKSFSIFLLGCVPCFYQFVEVLYILDIIHSSEKAMATHSSTHAWKIPWTEEPGRLQSMGSRRVRHDWTGTKWHWLVRGKHENINLTGKGKYIVNLEYSNTGEFIIYKSSCKG